MGKHHSPGLRARLAVRPKRTRALFQALLNRATLCLTPCRSPSELVRIIAFRTAVRERQRAVPT